MRIKSDLKRSYYQYIKHQKVGFMKLNIFHKFFLALIFFILIPFVLLNIFFINKNKNKKVFILEYEVKEPYVTIYSVLKRVKVFNFLKLNSFYIPVVPTIFLKDMLNEFILNPVQFLKKIPFYGALILKISRYYFLIKYHNVSRLIVFQEYSFYMSYLTHVLESENGKLYNIMHGIPGQTYCFFRFSKCFVWSDFYKNVYIKNGAEKSQFIVSGSIFHNVLKNYILNEEKNIDILYVMQGDVEGSKDVLEVLNTLSNKYVVKIKQHPRHRISINHLTETDDSIIEAIYKSKVIIGHFSTALLDAVSINKSVIAYLYDELFANKYLPYLDKSDVVNNKKTLYTYIENKINNEYDTIAFDSKYIDMTKNPIKVITSEIF